MTYTQTARPNSGVKENALEDTGRRCGDARTRQTERAFD